EAERVPIVVSWSCLHADNVRGLEALGTFQQIELHRFALIECAIPIFLDGRKMDENVFPGRALNETIAFRSVEPLYCALLSHKLLLSLLGRLTSDSSRSSCFNNPLKERGSTTQLKSVARNYLIAWEQNAKSLPSFGPDKVGCGHLAGTQFPFRAGAIHGEIFVTHRGTYVCFLGCRQRHPVILPFRAFAHDHHPPRIPFH